MAGFYHYGKHADAQFHFSLQTTSTILIRWTGLLHQFYWPSNPLRVAIEDPFIFSERHLEVQSFITRRNPGRMFILTTKAVSIRVYDLKHPTIFPSFRKSFFPVSVFNIHWILIRMLSFWFTFSLQAMSPSTFYPPHNVGFFLQDTLLKGLLQSGHVYELMLVIVFSKQKETVLWLVSVFWWKLIWKI